MGKKGMFDSLIALGPGKTLSYDEDKVPTSIKDLKIIPTKPSSPYEEIAEKFKNHEERLTKLETLIAQEKTSQPVQGFDKIKQIQKLLRSAPLEVKETEFFKTLEYIVQS